MVNKAAQTQSRTELKTGKQRKIFTWTHLLLGEPIDSTESWLSFVDLLLDLDRFNPHMKGLSSVTYLFSQAPPIAAPSLPVCYLRPHGGGDKTVFMYLPVLFLPHVRRHELISLSAALRNNSPRYRKSNSAFIFPSSTHRLEIKCLTFLSLLK